MNNQDQIVVCGAGTMGSGIAQVVAAAGYQVVLFDLNSAVLNQAQQRLEKSLASLVLKNKMKAEEKQAILQHILFTSDVNLCKGTVVIEAIIENMEAKVSLFHQLSQINSSATIFASNTSSLSVSQLANALPHPEKVAGLHFFNPAPLMKLVEVVRAEKTHDDTIASLKDFTQKLGKTAVVCKDAPGFIVNRVARPYYIEALRLVEEGLAELQLIDEVMEQTGFRMGPFKLMDLIGNDINYAVSCSVYEQMGRPERLKPSYIQAQKVEEGALGRKSGRGYYHYED